MRSAVLVVLAVLPLGCTPEPASPAPVPPEAAKPFEAELLKVAAEYRSWGRVDDLSRWAPYLCMTPPPAEAAFSNSNDEDTHGRKLYSLFARHRDHYMGHSKDKTPPPDQAVVKQSWVPEEITNEKEKPPRDARRQENWIQRSMVPHPNGRPGMNDQVADYFYPFAWQGDKVFKVAKPADLFVMMKLDPKTPGTDDGWVYGTLTPDGTTVTASGRIESCMKCHREAKHDRLFGLKNGK